MTNIGDLAFAGCTTLTSIEIPDSVTSIGSDAFENTAYYNDENNWENDVLYIGNHLIGAKSSTFNYETGEYNNDGIQGACTIKQGTKTIAGSAFEDCTGLASITIGNSVTSIGDSAFRGCTSLTSVTIPDSVTSIGDSAFRGCTSLASVTIPNSVTSIGDFAFNGCTNLQRITIPNSVTSIGYDAFSGCTSLASVTIPDSVTSIGSYAFSDCTALTSIEIPDSVTSIGEYAFCYYWDRKPLENLTIYGIEGSYAQTYAQENELNFVPIFETEEKADGTIEITGYNAPSSKISIPSTINGKAVTSISANAFANNANLEKITIPDSVVEIAAGAFNGCSENLVISASADSAAEAYAKENGITFEEIQSAAQLGNVNGDEDINATDATLVLQYFAKIITDSAPNFDRSAADVNNDGDINATDATLILQYFAKIITSF